MTGFATDRQKTEENHYLKMLAYFSDLVNPLTRSDLVRNYGVAYGI